MREQRPPLGETQRITVTRGDRSDPYEEREEATVLYQRREDGWYVSTPADGGYWRFASADARDRDVRQLINKKWCLRYGDPDDWTDRS